MARHGKAVARPRGILNGVPHFVFAPGGSDTGQQVADGVRPLSGNDGFHLSLVCAYSLNAESRAVEAFAKNSASSSMHIGQTSLTSPSSAATPVVTRKTPGG